MRYYEHRVSIQNNLTKLSAHLKKQMENADLLHFNPAEIWDHVEENTPNLVICKPVIGKNLLDIVHNSWGEIEEALYENSHKTFLVMVGNALTVPEHPKFPHLFMPYDLGKITEVSCKLLDMDGGPSGIDLSAQSLQGPALQILKTG